jgi:hypothetical protein
MILLYFAKRKTFEAHSPGDNGILVWLVQFSDGLWHHKFTGVD